MIEINNKRILIYDFETDGFFTSAGYTRPIEVAVLDIDLNRKDYNFYHEFIARRDNTPLPEKIVEITGITTELLKEKGKDIKTVFDELALLFEDQDNIFVVGHNILKFDNRFMNQRFHKYGHYELRDDICFDTAGEFKAGRMNIIKATDEPLCEYHRRALNKPIKGLQYKMEVCLDYYNIEETVARHRADVDVTYNLKLLIEQLKESITVSISQENIEYLDNVYLEIMEKWQDK